MAAALRLRRAPPQWDELAGLGALGQKRPVDREDAAEVADLPDWFDHRLWCEVLSDGWPGGITDRGEWTTRLGAAARRENGSMRERSVTDGSLETAR
jgi:hypothetical protein